MRSVTALLSLLPLFSSLASSRAIDQLQKRDGCPNVHLVLARGNDEPYPGRQGDLVTSVCARFPEGTCDYEDVIYDNPKDFYCVALNDGPRNMLSQVTDFNKRCPDSHIVLSGYSQGAQVVGDVLGGGGGKFYDGCVQQDNAGLDPSSVPANKIAVALIFGDMRHTASQSYNYGSGSGKSSQYPRPDSQLAGMNKFASIIRSYCDDVDPICARGNDGKDHEQYFDHYKEDAASYVQEKINALQSQSTTGNSDPGDVQQAAVAASSTVYSTLLAAVAAESPTPSSSADQPSSTQEVTLTTTAATTGVSIKESATASVTPSATEASQATEAASSTLTPPTNLATATASQTSDAAASATAASASPSASGSSAAWAMRPCDSMIMNFFVMSVMAAFALL